MTVSLGGWCGGSESVNPTLENTFLKPVASDGFSFPRRVCSFRSRTRYKRELRTADYGLRTEYKLKTMDHELRYNLKLSQTAES